MEDKKGLFTPGRMEHVGTDLAVRGAEGRSCGSGLPSGPKLGGGEQEETDYLGVVRVGLGWRVW